MGMLYQNVSSWGDRYRWCFEWHPNDEKLKEKTDFHRVAEKLDRKLNTCQWHLWRDLIHSIRDTVTLGMADKNMQYFHCQKI